MNDTNKSIATTRISIKFKENGFEARRVELEKTLLLAKWIPMPKQINESSPKIERDIRIETESLNAQVSEMALREFGSREFGSAWKMGTLEITRDDFIKFLWQDFKLTLARLSATISLYETAIIGDGFEEYDNSEASV